MRPFLRLPTTRWLGYGGLLAALLALPLGAWAQAPPPGTNCLALLKNQDLSCLCRADRLAFYGNKTAAVLPEPLG